jgi:precorrin-6Y C5,15-methyltransferase (decarboxylating)
LAAGRFDPLSVVVVIGPGGLPLLGWSPGGERVLAWGAPETAFDHGDATITKAEVRAVVLGKLGLPARGVVWDVGAGSGSVAIECSLVRPGLTVMAVEHDTVTAARITANAVAMGASVHVVPGRAPEALTALPDPDRVYIGGAGRDILDVVLARLRPGGRVVAAHAALDHAAAAAERLGSMTQLSVARGERLAEGGWRLAADNPVFVVWGPA